MKLISCTEFVIGQWSIDLNASQRDRIKNYAEFLKQPLTLSMFMPLGENGEVLEEPNLTCKRPNSNGFCQCGEEQVSDCRDWWYKWQQAKNNVIFEGFELKGKTDFSWIFKHNGIFPVMVSKNRTIEYLTLILKKEITITQTAVEKFKLK